MVYFTESNDRTTPEEADRLSERVKVAGLSRPQFKLDQPAKARARSMSEASFRSLQRKLAALEEEEKEQDAVNTLVSMVAIITQRDNPTHHGVLETPLTESAEEPQAVSSGSVTLVSTTPTMVDEDITRRNLRPRNKGESRRKSLPVAAKMPSKVTVKVPKHGTNKGPNMRSRYNKFRACIVVLVGTKEIKAFQTGTFQANVSFLWKKLSLEEQVTFDGQSETEQRAMLAKIMHPAESEPKKSKSNKNQRNMEVVKSPRPRRNVARAQKSAPIED